MTARPLFEVDPRGLSQILARSSKASYVLEAYQNAVDEKPGRIDMTFETVPGKSMSRLVVEDDSPRGWENPSHCWTLFSPSYKKGDPTLAGRFNVGEKLLAAASVETTIETMHGTIRFADGERQHGRQKRERGTRIESLMRMTRQEHAEALALLRRLIVPEGIKATLNGEPVVAREVLARTSAKLSTEIADAEGRLRPTQRTTSVKVYEPPEGEVAMLYELGIPIVSTKDRFDVSIGQKIPLSLDRAGLIRPGYLRDVRAIVLNATIDLLSAEDASEKWVDAAIEDDLIEPEAVEGVLDKRFGEKRVIFDPSDHEANRIAASEGYTVIGGRTFSREAWGHIKDADAAKPAGQVTPSPKPFGPNGDELTTIPPDKWTPEQANLASYARALHEKVLGRPVAVRLVEDREWGFRGTYGAGGLTLNLASVKGRGPGYEVDDLLIHEFAHHAGGHLTGSFDRALSQIGAVMVTLTRDDPDWHKRWVEKA